MLSGNLGNGIILNGASSGTLVQGNYIGVASNGSALLPNGANGITVFDSLSNVIGGTTAGARQCHRRTSHRCLDCDSCCQQRHPRQLDLLETRARHRPRQQTASRQRRRRCRQRPERSPELPGPDAATGGVPGTLNSTPNTAFRIEFFGNAACDASSTGKGRRSWAAPV